MAALDAGGVSIRPEDSQSNRTEASIDNIVNELLAHAEGSDAVPDGGRLDFSSMLSAAQARGVPDQPPAAAPAAALASTSQREADDDGDAESDFGRPEDEDSFVLTPSQDLGAEDSDNLWYESSGVEAFRLGHSFEQALATTNQANLSDPDESDTTSAYGDRPAYARTSWRVGSASHHGAHGAALEAMKRRLLQAMQKEARLHIRAEMARTEMDVLRERARQSDARAAASERKARAVDAKIKSLRAQASFQQLKNLQTQIAKAAEVNARLLHRLQNERLELRKERARRKQAEKTIHSLKTTYAGIEDLGVNFLAGDASDDAMILEDSAEMHKLQNQVRHLKGALEQSKAANKAIISHIHVRGPSALDGDAGYEDTAAAAPASAVVEERSYGSDFLKSREGARMALAKASLGDADMTLGYASSSAAGTSRAAADFSGGGVGGGGPGPDAGVPSTSNVPPQSMNTEALKHAREAYQDEKHRMRQLFLSRLSTEGTSPAGGGKTTWVG